jgi:hypothetical protein
MNLIKIDYTKVKEKHKDEIRAARLSAYVLEADPLFFEWQAGDCDKKCWETKRAEIRARYPYTE